MALLPNKANTPGNNQGQDDRSPLPAGKYNAHIVKSEMKATKAKNGHYLSVHWKVLEGDQLGKMVFCNLNLDNPNPIAVEIATKELNSICQAVGLVGVEDSAELHEKPCTITVKVDPGTAQFPPGNSITAYEPISGATGNAPSFATEANNAAGASEENAPAQQQEDAPAPSSADAPKKMPWE